MRRKILFYLLLPSILSANPNTSYYLELEKIKNDPMVKSRVQRLSEELGVYKSSLEKYFTDISEIQKIEASGRAPSRNSENIVSCLNYGDSLIFGRDLVLQCFGSFYSQWDHETYQAMLVQIWNQSKNRKSDHYSKNLRLFTFLANQVSDRLRSRFDSNEVFYKSKLFYKHASFEFKGLDFNDLQNGDVLLVSSANPKAQLNTIPFKEYNRFTHAMTFLRDPDGSEYFIEAEASQGTTKTTANERREYFNSQTHVLILRFFVSPTIIDVQTRNQILNEFRSQLNLRIGSAYNLSLNSVDGPLEGLYTCTELIRESFIAAVKNVLPNQYSSKNGIHNFFFTESFSSFSDPLIAFAKTFDMILDKTFSPDDIIDTSAFQIVGEVVRHNLSFKTFVDQTLAKYFKDGITEATDFINNSSISYVTNDQINNKVIFRNFESSENSFVFDFKSIDPKFAYILNEYLRLHGIHINNNNEIDAEKSLVEFLNIIEKRIILHLENTKKNQVAFILPGEIENALNKEEDQNPMLRLILKSPLFSKKIMDFIR